MFSTARLSILRGGIITGVSYTLVVLHTNVILSPYLRQEPLSLMLRGRSLRPMCHFALQESPDYLQRRQSNLLANELGQQGLAIESASVRVVEVISRGTNVRNTRRFVHCHTIPTNNIGAFCRDDLLLSIIPRLCTRSSARVAARQSVLLVTCRTFHAKEKTSKTALEREFVPLLLPSIFQITCS